MFVYNIKINGAKTFKTIFIIILILLLFIMGSVMWRFVNASKEKTDIVCDIKASNYTNILKATHENINNYVNNEIYNEEIEIDKLVEAMKNFLNRKKLEKPLKTKITNKEYSVKERKNSIRNIIRNKKRVEFTELFEEYNKSYIAVTFLSVLELAKAHELKISQDKNFDNIFIEGAS